MIVLKVTLKYVSKQMNWKAKHDFQIATDESNIFCSSFLYDLN